MQSRPTRPSEGTMPKRPRVSLSLIIAETTRLTPSRRVEPPVLHLVSPTGGQLAQGDNEPGEGGEPVDFVWARIGQSLDAIQQLARCRNWLDVLDVQQSWVERAQADYASACAMLTGAAIRMVTGATTYPEPPPSAA